MNKFLLIVVSMLLVFMLGCTAAQSPAPADVDEDWTIPTPSQDTAVVFGTLRDLNDKPVGDGIFLAENITYDSPDLPPTVSFSYQYSPRATVDTERGYFYFDQVEPAENYVIAILSGPGDFVFVTEDNGENPVTIAVSAGESLDLGLLLVEMP